jgi:hypothetical protein
MLQKYVEKIQKYFKNPVLLEALDGNTDKGNRDITWPNVFKVIYLNYLSWKSITGLLQSLMSVWYCLKTWIICVHTALKFQN